ncbi:Hypothetical predicted protein, partial [Olea europaea subsp. europaea]
SCHNNYERDNYGMLTEILELELDYLGDVGNKVILFKCDWFDINGGVRVHRRFGLIELNHKKKLQTNDVFILAKQARQVYYTCFPTKARDRLDWWVVVKTKARNVPNIQGIISENEECNVWVELAFQEDQPPSTLKPSSMPRVSIVQDEEDREENENGSEESDGSLSTDDNDAADCRKRGPNHGTNGSADESGRIP